MMATFLTLQEPCLVDVTDGHRNDTIARLWKKDMEVKQMWRN